MSQQIRRRVRDAMQELEEAAVEIDAAESHAAGRGGPGGNLDRARTLFLSASGSIGELPLTPDERRRASALSNMIGLFLALREALGPGTSIASRFLA